MLQAIVFICGAVLMVLELVGSRVLAPYIGTSIIVWTSLIGIILGCLSFGYYLGGKIADQKATFNTLSLIILAAAAGIVWVVLSNRIFLASIVDLMPTLYLQSIFLTTILFAPASILLGMVSPYCVKLKLNSLAKSGTTVGSLYAISTCGSILGTFLGGFILVSLLGTEMVLIILAIILFLTSFLAGKGNFSRKLAVLLLILVTLILPNTSKGKPLADVDTQYNRILILEDTDSSGQPIIVMKASGENDSAIYQGNDELVYPYSKFFRLANHFKGNIKTALTIGGAGYSYPKDFLRQYPNAQMDVVEIDPGMTDLARKYFRLMDDPRLSIYHEDGRTFLNHTIKKYDVIYGDAFKSYSPPFSLTTKEAVQKMHGLLAEDGVVIMNIVSAVEGKKGLFLQAEYATYKSIFPQVFVFAVDNNQNGEVVQNLVLVALKSEGQPEFASNDPEINSYLSQLWKKPIPDGQILTDDYAPVEQYIAQIFLNDSWHQ